MAIRKYQKQKTVVHQYKIVNNIMKNNFKYILSTISF